MLQKAAVKFRFCRGGAEISFKNKLMLQTNTMCQLFRQAHTCMIRSTVFFFFFQGIMLLLFEKVIKILLKSRRK